MISFLYLIWKNFTLLRHKLFDVLLCGWRGVLPLNFFRCINMSLYIFFLDVLAISGNDFDFFSSTNKLILELVDRMDKKFVSFCQVDTRDLAILVIKKNCVLDFFEVFLGLIRKCLGIVCALKRPTFGCAHSSKGR